MPKPDYQSLIDADIWSFIDRTNAFFPPDSALHDIAALRSGYDRMCAAFRQPLPCGVASRDQPGSVPLRIYETANPSGTLVYFHGGGFVVGGLESHDDVCAEICARAGLRVISVAYRLAPEHRHPAAFTDALFATRQMSARYGSVILAGDSAGGCLAASVAHTLRGSPVRISGVVLIYPGLGAASGTESMMRHAEAPMLTAADIEFYWETHGASRNDTTAAPLLERDFSNLPTTWICGAECDPLCDDGRLYAKKIREAGGTACFRTEPGLVHGWLRARYMSPKAADAFSRIIKAIREISTPGKAQ
tara:strand:+ start:16338 stop:17252 length:915 start_codon:yes stop_codon:yes gene_type:complete